MMQVSTQAVWQKELVRMRNRRGVALLTVVLFSALVFVVIVAVSSGVATESSVTSTDLGFKRALAVAETGIAQTTGDLQSVKWVSGVSTVNSPDAYLTASQIENIAAAKVGDKLTFDLKPFPDGGSTFQVKVRKISGDVWDRSSSFKKSVHIGIYSLGEAFVSKTGSASGLLGRRVLYSEATVDFDLSGGSVAAFDYGLFSGGEITFQGSTHSVVREGSIYAIGKIDLAGKQRLDGNPYYAASRDAEVVGSSGDTAWDSGDEGGPEPVSFPQISLGFWYDRANDFKTGSNYYAAPAVAFPYSYPATIIQSYLGASDTSPTLDQVQTFCNDLVYKTGAWGLLELSNPGFTAAFRASFPDPAFYVVGGGTIAGNFAALGSIVISGPGDPHDAVHPPATTSVGLKSGGTIISNEGGLALLIHGDFTGAGGAIINGLVYCDGSFINGSGQLTVNGSIVAINMSHLSGQFNLTFDKTLNIPVGGFPTAVSGDVSVTNVPGTWVEKDFSEFTDAS